MARTAINRFELANALYKNGVVSFYTVAAGVKTSVLATLYASPTPSNTAQLANPQKLDSRGKLKQPVYADVPVIATIEGVSVPTHDTGVISPAPIFRVNTTTGELEYSFDGGVSWTSTGNPAGQFLPVADAQNTVDASKGAGLIGFTYALGYAAGTIGKWLKDLATSAGASFIGYIQSGAGAVARTLTQRIQSLPLRNDFTLASDWRSAVADIADPQLSQEQIENLQDDLGAISSSVGTDSLGIPFTDPSAIVAPNVTNLADPDVTDSQLPATADHLHRVYNSGGGALNAQSPSTLGTFAVTKKYNVTAGTEYTVSLHNAPVEFLLYFVSGGEFLCFYNTDESHHSNLTAAQFTRAADARSAVFTVPAGAERVAFNLRNSVLFSNTDPMTEEAVEQCLLNVMINEGATALPFAPFNDGTLTATSDTFDPEQESVIEVVKQGEFFYIRADCQLSEDKDVVWRVRVNHAASYNAVNSKTGIVDFYGIRFIDKDDEATVSAFNQSMDVHNVGMDESCPIKLNSMFLAGTHGVIGYKATAVAHGKANEDVGSIWDDGIDEWVLYYIDSADAVTFVRRYSGASDEWTISTQDFGSGTLTHVSGATNTGDVTVTASAQAQVIPIIRGYLAELRVDDVPISDDGTYKGERVTLGEVYSLLNAALQQDYLIAEVGAASPDLDNADIGEQVRFYYEFEWNLFGAMSIRTAQGVKDNYRRAANIDYWGGLQLQRLSLVGDVPSGMHDEVHLYVPEIAPVDGYDLEAVADITSNAANVVLPRTSCDDPDDPASHFCLIGKDSGGVTLSGHLFGYSREEGNGVPATRAAKVDTVLLFSAAEKMYPFAVDGAAGDAAEGDVESVTAFRAPFMPTDADLTVPGVVVTMSGETYVYITAHQTLTQKSVAIPDKYTGKAVTTVKGHANVTVHSTFVSAAAIIISVSSGYGDVVLRLG